MFEIDRTLKVFAIRFPDDFVHWLVGPGAHVVEQLQGELSATLRQADLVYRAEDAQGRPFVFHLEFQTERSRPPMGLRMAGYHIRLLEQYGLPVCGAVLYLQRGSDAGDTGRFESLCPRGLGLQLSYQVIRLWEEDGLVLLREGLVGLYPLLGLTELGEPSEEGLQQIVTQIRQVEDVAMRQDMLFGFQALAGLRFARELLEALVHKEEIMESPLLREIYQKGLQEGLEKGLEEGKELGSANAMRKDVLRFLAARFKLTVHTRKVLEMRLARIESLTTLEELVTTAGRINSVNEFTATLDALEAEE